jgi:hypothetical protein
MKTQNLKSSLIIVLFVFMTTLIKGQGAVSTPSTTMINGCLNVSGSATIDSALVVSDTVKAQDVIITGNANVAGNINVAGKLMFDDTHGFSFTPGAGTSSGGSFLFGKATNPPPVAFNPCNTITQFPSFFFGGRIQLFDQTAGVSLIMGSDGAQSSIDHSGNGNGLLINYYCGKNIFLGTGTGGGGTAGTAGAIVYTGDKLYARKHFQIGSDFLAINTNVSLNIYKNATTEGIKFNSFANTEKLINVNNPNFATSPFTVMGDGRTIIGGELPTNTPYLLTVNGKIGAREIKVSLQNPWPDYVFESSYIVKQLPEIEKYIKKNKHLPGIPSAAELQNEECGLDLAKMQALQMQKIEEVYLHLIEMNKEIKNLKEENKKLKDKLSNK